ncbi:MAG: M16 family metallopeptidase [Sandaracinaceae bacterium]
MVLDPLPGRGTVALVVGVDAGRRDQPAGWSGLAHFTEHLLFQGTDALPRGAMTHLEELGATGVNAMTSDDATTYFEVVPRERLERAIWLEAERFAHGVDGLTQAELEAQRRVVDRERELRTARRQVVWELVRTQLYRPDHPYGGARERREDVHAIGVQNVRWFFQRHYMPDRLTLALSGGFDPEQARGWIERYFGPLRRGPIAAPPARSVPPRVVLRGERRLVVEAPRSNDALVVIWPSPAWGAPEDAELDYVAHELEHRLESRLVRPGRARSVSVSQRSRPLGSTFQVTIQVPLRSGTAAPLEALDEELASMGAEPMDAASFAAAEQSWMENERLRMEDPQTRARRYSQTLPGMPNGVYDLASNLARYGAVTRDGVRRSVRMLLPANHRIVVSLSGRPGAPPEGEIVADITVGGGR